MANVDDVAAALIDELGPMTALKLQKLTYYTQAIHLVSLGEPLFDDPIQAWERGPVCRTLWERHRGARNVDTWTAGRSDRLTYAEMETVRAVAGHYGHRHPEALEKLTHDEAPWAEAWAQGKNTVIDPQVMLAFYAAGQDDEWLAMNAEADDDVAAGRTVGPFDNLDELLESLD
jgi:uncharacterized phage-associated protein